MCGWCASPQLGLKSSIVSGTQIICRSYADHMQIICLQYSDNIMWDVGNEIANKPTFDGLSFFLVVQPHIRNMF